MTGTARSAGSAVKQAHDSRTLELAARAGIVALGLVHLLIAWLALRIAWGGGGGDADQDGAFRAIAAQPMGRVLLWVLVLGFVAVVVWRVGAAMWGFRYVAGRRRRIGKRVVCAGQAVIFAALAVAAGSSAAGTSSGGDGGSEATAGVLGLPGGQVLVALVGIGVLVAGAAMIVQGWRAGFTEDQDLGRADARARRLNLRTGQVGYIAKGSSIAVLGVLIVFAAVTSDPDQADGLDAALTALAEQPHGTALLTAMALGLGVYGVFCFSDARYRRI